MRSQTPCSNPGVWSEVANLSEQPVLRQSGTLQLFLYEAALGQRSTSFHTEAFVLHPGLNTRGLWEGDEREGLNVTSIREIGTYSVAGVICFRHFRGLFEFIIQRPSDDYAFWHITEERACFSFLIQCFLFAPAVRISVSQAISRGEAFCFLPRLNHHLFWEIGCGGGAVALTWWPWRPGLLVFTKHGKEKMAKQKKTHVM